MKKLSLILLGSAISFAMVTGVFAQSADTTAAKTTAKPAAKAKKATTMYVTGTVTAVDAAANTLTVEKKVKKETKSYTFTAGSKVKLADIAKDSKVTVAYTKDGDKLTASSVKAVVAKKAKAAATTAAPSKDTTKM